MKINLTDQLYSSDRCIICGELVKDAYHKSIDVCGANGTLGMWSRIFSVGRYCYCGNCDSYGVWEYGEWIKRKWKFKIIDQNKYDLEVTHKRQCSLPEEDF